VVVPPVDGDGISLMIRRWLRHLGTTHFTLRRCFPPAALAGIDAAITASEQQHQAEIRFAVETALPVGHLWRGVSCRARAQEIWSLLGMADTAARNGILVYVLLAERDIEIIADRGFSDRLAEPVWADICNEMSTAFRNGDYGPGAVRAIGRLNDLAVANFPARSGDRNELPNAPLVL
jgi:uncharacterized membrane protein